MRNGETLGTYTMTTRCVGSTLVRPPTILGPRMVRRQGSGTYSLTKLSSDPNPQNAVVRHLAPAYRERAA